MVSEGSVAHELEKEDVCCAPANERLSGLRELQTCRFECCDRRVPLEAGVRLKCQNTQAILVASLTNSCDFTSTF
jgi:hypothetical protein